MRWVKAQKKSIIVDAIEITEKNVINLHNFDDRLGHINRVPFCDTLEGTMIGKIGDFIIKGIKGELYICDRHIFFETYDILET